MSADLHPRLASRMARIALSDTTPPPPADVIDLVQTEAPATPAVVAQAAAASLERGETHYTDRAGILPLREALAARLVAEGLDADPERLIVTNGGSEARFIALQTLLPPGGRVLAVGPLHADVRRMLQLLGAQVVDLPLRGSRRFRPDAADVAAALPGVDLVLLADPCPISGVSDPDSAQQVLELAVRQGTRVLLDRSAAWQQYGGVTTPLDLAADAPVWVVGSFSGTWAMHGWRVGFLLTPKVDRGGPLAFKESMSICTSSLAQHVALAVLADDGGWLAARRTDLAARRERVLQELAFGGVDVLAPDAWPSLLLHTWAVHPDDVQAVEMLERQGRVRVEAASRHGAGLVGWVRIVLGDEEQTLEGVRRLIGFHLTC